MPTHGCECQPKSLLIQYEQRVTLSLPQPCAPNVAAAEVVKRLREETKQIMLSARLRLEAKLEEGEDSPSKMQRALHWYALPSPERVLISEAIPPLLSIVVSWSKCFLRWGCFCSTRFRCAVRCCALAWSIERNEAKASVAGPGLRKVFHSLPVAHSLCAHLDPLPYARHRLL